MKLISLILFSVILNTSFAIALPPDDFEPWRMYAVYETGYDVGKDILKGVYGSVSLLHGCMEKSDYSSWKAIGWDAETIRKAEKLFFYGCINANTKKMAKEEFIKNMFKNMMESK